MPQTLTMPQLKRANIIRDIEKQLLREGYSMRSTEATDHKTIEFTFVHSVYKPITIIFII